MGEQKQAAEKKSGAGALATRVALIAILVVVVIFAVVWRSAASEYRRAVELYDEGKYQEAADLFESVIARPVSVIKIRPPARVALGRCKMELASEIAFKDRSLDGYTRALKLLEEARPLVGPSEELERRIKEYGEYKVKAEEAEKAAAAAKAAEETAPAPAPAEGQAPR